jgi:hypothetical protein
LSGAVLSPHALERMAVRQVTEAAVRAMLRQPETVQEVRPGRVVAQGIFRSAEGSQFLLRAFVDIDCHPPTVATVYKTSKIGKYRRQP